MTIIVAFDTETTGLIPNNIRSNHTLDDPELLDTCPYITQLSYVMYDTENENVQLANYYIQLNENVTITHTASDITKIYKTTEDVLKRDITNFEEITILETLKYPKIKNIEEVLDEILPLLYSADIIACHNVYFDRKMLFIELTRLKRIKDRIKLCLLKDKFICTMLATTSLCKIPHPKYLCYKWPKLKEAYEILLSVKINENAKMHNSLIDTLMCLVIYCNLNKDKIMNIDKINHPKINYILESLILRRSPRIYNKIMNSI